MGEALTGRTRLLGLLCAVLASACSVVNDIDVCERAGPADVQANVRTEGAQLTHGRGALASLPNEGAMLAFLSAPPGDVTARRELRVALLTQTGDIIRTCDAPGGGAVDVVSLADDGDMLRYRPFVATAAEIGGSHLLVWSETPGWPQPGEVRGIGLYSTGCVRFESFAISDSPEWIPNIAHAVRTGENQYAIVWTESLVDETTELVTATRAMGRVVQLFGDVEFLGTVHSLEGAPAVLGDLGDPIVIGAARIDDDRFAVAGIDGARDMVVRVSVVDDRLEVHESYEVTRVRGAGPPVEASVDVVWNGERLLVLWTQIDDERLVAHGRWAEPGAGPRGPSFRIGGHATGEQLDLAGAAMGDGRIFVSWEDRNAAGSAGSDGDGIRGLMLDRRGAVQFANPACGRGDFAVNTTTRGNQWNPASTVLDDGTVIVAFTDDSGQGVDRSESGVRARVFRSEQLLPVE